MHDFVSLSILLDDQLCLEKASVFDQGNLEFGQGKVREFCFHQCVETRHIESHGACTIIVRQPHNFFRLVNIGDPQQLSKDIEKMALIPPLRLRVAHLRLVQVCPKLHDYCTTTARSLCGFRNPLGLLCKAAKTPQ